MNVNEYIESGILDVYVLGGLSPEEATEVELFTSKFPEIKKEIEAIRFTIEEFSSGNNIAPSGSVKQNIFEKINIHKFSQNEDTNSFDRRNINYSYLALAASWLITLVCGGLAFYYKQQWHDTKGELMALQNENKELATNFNVTKNSYQQISEQLSAINDSSLKVVTLKSVPGKPNTYVQVFWSKSKHQVLFNGSSLPGAPPGKQYQLWAIVDGKPVDAGMLSKTDNTHLFRMKDVENASAFAITLEKEGGSPVPTMAEMYVMGII